MSTAVWNVHSYGRHLRDDRNLSVYAKALLFVLATHADRDTGYVAARFKVSYDLLAVEGSMSRRSVANAVKEAEAAGWLTVHTPSKADARRNGATNAYTLLMPVSSAPDALVQVHPVHGPSAPGARKTAKDYTQGLSANADSAASASVRAFTRADLDAAVAEGNEWWAAEECAVRMLDRGENLALIVNTIRKQTRRSRGQS